MRLKKLELYGFKSFAQRTEIVFNEGITAIVGPNGSGKSNIGDAVRWVLGEQSAKTLRGASMQDVIFSGTQTRKPLSYCEVSLIFDNEDHTLPLEYAEVMVTRRVYRSGESEYFLNRSSCRLKDVIDLFRDTGIGKEGYSIIGQGRIDEILSRKGEDRRLVCEEAAGIVKFKARKEEADRKLNRTLENMTRVDDILDELPFDLNADIVEIEDRDYAEWERDISEEPDKYEGKILRLHGFVVKSRDKRPGHFGFGRQVMTCCEADIAFLGFPAVCMPESQPVSGSWIELTARVELQRSGEETLPVLMALTCDRAEKPAVTLATFY